MKKIFIHIFSFMVPTALIMAVLCTLDIFFEINDDRYITEILSGVITLKPDAHTVYINYLLSLVLACLYSITKAIPWYGGLLILIYWFSYVAIFEATLSCAKKIKDAVVFTILIVVFFVMHLHLIGQIQYTSVAAFAAVTGFFCLMVHQNKKIGMILFVLFETFAFLLRDQSMLMILPLGMAMVVGIILGERKLSFKDRIVTIIKICITFITIVMVGYMGNAIGYSKEEWQEYRRFNQARTEVFDYYGKPLYEEVDSILQKYGVTREEYNALCHYTILGENISSACFEEIADYASTQVVRLTPKEVFQKMFDIMFRDNYWKINCVIVLMWFFAFILSVFNGNWRNLLAMLFLFLARTVVWMYLIWGERMPLRVTIPLMAAETIFLLILVLRIYLDVNHIGKVKYILLFAMCIVFCYFGVKGGKQQYRYILEQHIGQEIYFEGFREIIEYCHENPETRYIIEAESLMYYRGRALETDVYQTRNFLVSGGWFSTAPNISEKNHSYMKGNQDGFQFIIVQNENQMTHPATAYLREISGNDPVKYDEFAVSHGGIYSVLYFADKAAKHE